MVWCIASKYAHIGVPTIADGPSDRDEEKRDDLKEAEVEEGALGNGVGGAVAEFLELRVIVGHEPLRELTHLSRRLFCDRYFFL